MTYGAWLLFGLVISASYGGSLRAHILKPEYTSPVDTVADIVDSGLPWNFVMYGEDLERQIPTRGRDDPVLEKFWEQKILLDFETFPFQKASCCPR